MSLFTLFITHGSESIVSQIRASTPRQSAERWVESIRAGDFSGVGRVTKNGLIEDIKDSQNPVVKVDGTSEVHCLAALSRGKLFMFHIVKTNSIE